MKKDNSKARFFVLTALSASILAFNNPVFALQALEDYDLRRIDGQDGVDLTTEYSQVDIDSLYWEDKAGTASNVEQALRFNATGVKIRDTNASDGFNLGTNFKIDAGSNGSTVGLNALITSNPSTISVDGFGICDTQVTPVCGSSAYSGSMGSLAIQSASPITIGLITTDGLFNESAQAQLNLGINNINLYLGQKLTTSATTQNQLILKNLNFNFTGKGVVFVNDTDGLKLQTNVGSAVAAKTNTPTTTLGYVDFTRANDPDQATLVNGTYGGTNAGLNLEFMLKPNADMTLTNPYTLTGSKGLIRVGASGRIVNGYLQVRGTTAFGIGAPTDDNVNNIHTLNNVLGFANTSALSPTTGNDATVLGSTGVGFRMKGEFTAAGDSMLSGGGSPTTLEIGGAGLNTFGFEFGNLSPLVSNSTNRAYFDSGDIYINLVNTRYLQMPENSVLRTSRFGGTTNTFLTTSADYRQQVHELANNPYAVALAIRGMKFQALSKQGRFTSSSNVSAGNAIGASAGLTNQWGLGLPIYNLNANLATYGTEYTGDVFTLNNATNVVTKSTVTGSQRLGLSLALSTEGRDATGSQTTSILLIDDGDRDLVTAGVQPTDYYFGLRNIDMLLSGYGSMGFENGNLNVTLKNLMMVMAAELAAGYLPGAQYKSCVTCISPANNFQLSKDVLLGLKIKLLGDMNFALIPNNSIADGNRLSIVGEYRLTDGTVQLSDPIDNSMVGLDKMSGLIRFNNAIVIGKDSSAQNYVGFNYEFTFNPQQVAADVFRVKDVNFYPPLAATDNRGQRLGEMVLTGGRLNANMSIVPRN